METEIETTALVLPDRDKFITDIKAINEFQQVARQFLIEGADWGVIPGTSKPTLLKPGAEKIAKLLGLSDQYIIEDRQENWDTGFFRFLIKCQLIAVRNGVLISEGLGECNSKESKYAYRWVSERDLPPGTDKTNLVSQIRHSRSGGKWTVYRFDNEDIYSQVNTLLKMAKKRALVDAALSAGRLSQVFTQDVEDMAIIHDEPVVTKPKAQASVAKSAPEEDLGSEDTPPTTAVATVEPETTGPPEPGVVEIDLLWLEEALKTLRDKKLTAYTEANLLSYMRTSYKVDAKTVLEGAAKLNKNQGAHFVKRIQETLEMV